MKKGWPPPKPNPAFCLSRSRHWFSEYSSGLRVDHCVRCGAKKVEVLDAQRELQRRKGKEGRS